jgi:hypothetical protein
MTRHRWILAGSARIDDRMGEAFGKGMVGLLGQ